MTTERLMERLEKVITTLDGLCMEAETIRGELVAAGLLGAGVRAGTNEMATARRTLTRVVAELVEEGR
jgi:hypothetical protein